MKTYYIIHGPFANTYNLVYVEIPDDYIALLSRLTLSERAERITRREAIAYCIAEKRRRRDNPNFAYYGAIAIYPADHNYDEYAPIHGYIVPKNKEGHNHDRRN